MKIFSLSPNGNGKGTGRMADSVTQFCIHKYIVGAVRGSTGLRLSEFVQISEFFQFYITDICQISESFAKSVNLE